MKISYSWLKSHLPLDMPAADLSAHLLKLGFEVAGLERVGPKFSGVVVGRVLAKDKHPNADKLAVCVVDDGSQKWNVVCGAPNVAAGQTIAFARIGAVLPGDFKIGKAKLRGVESQGMICSREELGLPKNEDGIWVLGEGPSLGTDVGSLLGPADDVLEVEITSNRPDCLSHRGLARELAAYFRLKLNVVDFSVNETLSATFPVTIEDMSACPYYTARLIEGVKVSPSPEKIRRRLEAVGLRPINNVVDVTNYVLMGLGQPLHAFDADKLAGSRIIIRRSRAGEKFRALDHKEYVLPAGLLVIADSERPVALAGVMGGEDSAVTEKTTRVVLESAFFAPSEIRRSAQATRLRSDSSYRFERGADPLAADPASARAAALILESAGGKAAKPAAAGKAPADRTPIRANPAALNRILGAAFPETAVKDSLRAIAADMKDEAAGFVFFPPSWRHDLATPNDLAEEVGRLLGYDGVPYRMAPAVVKGARLTSVETESRRVRSRLAALGLCEAYNYDLLSEKTLTAARLSAADQPRVDNPLSEDWAVLRPSLLPGLLRSAAYNHNRGQDAVRLFELGKTYAKAGAEVDETWRVAGLLFGPVLDVRWKSERAKDADFYDAKSCIDDLLERSVLGGKKVVWAKPSAPAAGRTPSDALFHPVNALRAVVDGNPVATLGWLHPSVARAFDLERVKVMVFDADLEALAAAPAQKTKYKEISPLPVSRRDVAVVVDGKTDFEKVADVIAACRIEELKAVDLFDVYQGKGVPEGKKSLAIRLEFGRSDRTLTDAEVAGFVDKAVKALGARLGAVLRS